MSTPTKFRSFLRIRCTTSSDNVNAPFIPIGNAQNQMAPLRCHFHSYNFSLQMASEQLDALPRRAREELSAALALEELSRRQEPDIDVVGDSPPQASGVSLAGLLGQKKSNRPHKYGKHTEEEKAEVRRMHFKDHIPVSDIIRQTGLPKSCVYDWIKGDALKIHGSHGFLSAAEQALLVSHIKGMARLGHGLTNETVRLEVGFLVRNDKERYAQLTNGLPSKC